MASRTRQDIPSEIVIEVTGQCNMHCAYCTRSGSRPGHLSLTEIKNVLNQAKAMGVKAVRISGGEPLLAPHFPDILAYAKKERFYILLNTNATLLTPALTRTITQTVDNVLVSLQGYNQASTEIMTRAPGNFKDKLGNIFLLKSCVPTLRLGTVVTSTLIGRFERYARLVERIAPAAWELFRPMTKPSGEKLAAPHVYRQLAAKLLKLHQKGLHAVIGNAIPFCILENRKAARLIFAGARADDGHTRLVYDARGFFKPSYFINTNLGANLEKAWRHPLLKKLDNPSCLPEKCRPCDDLDVCRGGSRVIAGG